MLTLTLDEWTDLRSLSEDDEDELEGFDFVDSGDLDSTAQIALMHSRAYQQLRAIFTAASDFRLTDEAVELLVSEVQHYLVAEMRRFQEMPELDFDLYSIGRNHIVTGLELLSEACLIARFSEQRTGLHKALILARQGDDELRIGRQLLDRATAIAA